MFNFQRTLDGSPICLLNMQDRGYINCGAAKLISVTQSWPARKPWKTSSMNKKCQGYKQNNINSLHYIIWTCWPVPWCHLDSKNAWIREKWNIMKSWYFLPAKTNLYNWLCLILLRSIRMTPPFSPWFLPGIPIRVPGLSFRYLDNSGAFRRNLDKSHTGDLTMTTYGDTEYWDPLPSQASGSGQIWWIHYLSLMDQPWKLR